MNRYINQCIYAWAMGTALCLGACNDFLDRAPVTDITPESYLWDVSHLAAYTIDRYPNILPSHGNWSFGTFGIDGGTDNMATPSYDNKYVPGQWRVGQTGGAWDFGNIYQCNYFLNTVVPRWQQGGITGSADAVAHYIGEGYFLRAYEYFSKLQTLGDFPIVTHVPRDDRAELTAASKRMPRTEVARFILSDLDSAALLMQGNSPDGARNRLSKACAWLLKSRVALFEATWLKYFANTAFVPNGEGWPGAGKDYQQGYQFRTGSLEAETQWLLAQAMEAAAMVADACTLTPNNGILQQSAADATNPYFDLFSAVDMSGYSEVLLWRRYSRGLSLTHNVPVYAQLGNYGVGLTRGMVDGFLMANGLPVYAEGSGYVGDDRIADVRQDRDGRLWLFLKEPGQTNVLYESQAGDHATPVEPVPDIANSSWEKTYSTGYAIRKGLNYDAEQCVNGGGYTGCLVFRATEAYLNYVEACYELNGNLDGRAVQYWQAIRTRAGVDTDFGKTVAATDMAREALNDWGAYSGGALVDATLYNIRRERRCELMAEGLRAMDLKRWRALDQLVSEPYHIEGLKLWGPMQEWYRDADGNLTVTYGTATATVSAPMTSSYLRPYEKTGKELVFDGYRWALAHYLEPIAVEHFLITSSDGETVSASPVYQNPRWPTEANMGALY
ncbi:MAG: RagB/SusD family nutrient uptake outer membrane protein [Breznakibacter sp.]